MYVLCSGPLWYTTEIFLYRCCKDTGISNRQQLCGRIFQQTIGISVETNCAPLLATCFYTRMTQSHESKQKHLFQQFNVTCRYIDDLLSLNYSMFSKHLEFIFPCELEPKEMSETITSSLYLDLYLYSDHGKLTTRLYDKRNEFNCPIVNFPFLSSSIPFALISGVHVSPLIDRRGNRAGLLI